MKAERTGRAGDLIGSEQILKLGRHVERHKCLL